MLSLGPGLRDINLRQEDSCDMDGVFNGHAGDFYDTARPRREADQTGPRAYPTGTFRARVGHRGSRRFFRAIPASRLGQITNIEPGLV